MQIRGTWSAGPGDDQARFLADLRALRDSAAIGYDELAARAHYPSYVLKEAENGPALPGLPILTAFVRACEGDVPGWEERWRRLNPEVADDPNLPVRPVGASAAAIAGARAGTGVTPPDVYDPDRIKAALRGAQGRSDPARNANDPGVSVPPPGGQRIAAAGVPDQGSGPGLDSAATWGGKGATGSGRSWDAPADPAVPAANGNHSPALGSRGPFDAAFTSTPDSAKHTEQAKAEEFSWLNKSQPEPAGPDADITVRLSPYQTDGLHSAERTDFWGQPLPSAGADPQGPVAAPRQVPRAVPRQMPAAGPREMPTAPREMPTAPRADGPGVTRAAWTAAAGTAAPQAPEPARRTTADAAFGTAAAAASQSHGPAAASQSHGPAAPGAQAAATRRDEPRRDRLFPARLLVVIVIAALIGSMLVLLLK